jgi:AcrR family transcriptional regulator
MNQAKLETILQTAKKMFARYGPRKTSIEEVARVARVAKATIYNNFGNKEQVYLEVLRREMHEVVENVSAEVEKGSSPDARLTVFVKAKFRYMRKAINILNLDRDGVENLLPLVEDIRNELFELEVNIIHAILKDGLEKGFYFLANPLLASRAIAHCLRGFELNWLVQENEENIDKYLDELINILFNGLKTKRRLAIEL